MRRPISAATALLGCSWLAQSPALARDGEQAQGFSGACGPGLSHLRYDADVLDVVLIHESCEVSPRIAGDMIDRVGRHIIVRPADTQSARSDYLLDPMVLRVQRVYYLTDQGQANSNRNERLSLTNRVAIKPLPGQSIEALVAPFDVDEIKSVSYSSEIFIVVLHEDIAPDVAEQLMSEGHTAFANAQFERIYSLRHIPNDAYFPLQWNLKNDGQVVPPAGQDIDITAAWDVVRGNGVTIGIVDNGVEWTHPDLFANYDPLASFDFNEQDADPTPVCTDSHGTGMAGIAAAVGDNDIGISGVAPNARIGGLRLLSGPFSDEDTAAALSYAADRIDIYNNSWGPSDDGVTLEGPGPLAEAAIQNGVTNGRGGLGSIFVWAAGNGGPGDNANFDGFASSVYVMAVGATTNNGTAASYSEPGACIFVNAPSGGGAVDLLSTDLTDICGSAPGDYRSDVLGTSGAAATVSGVVALMLERQPALTWRDVQHILVRSASINDPTDAGWEVNGAGLMIHHMYGFGRVDASMAVGFASQWDNVRPPLTASGSQLSNCEIPDNNAEGVSVVMNVPTRILLERVKVHVDIVHPRRGDLEIALRSPRGTDSLLATRRAADSEANLDWSFVTVRDWGEESKGNWTLTVRDLAPGAAGTLLSWSLEFFGSHIQLPKGDMNTDGRADFRDIPDFSLALRDQNAYRNKYPGIDPVLVGDVDGDGTLNVFDIQPFVTAIGHP